MTDHVNNELRIALVGPALPYRSGVALHTSHLQQALNGTGAPTEVFSFKRQYPSWLYPGKDTPPDVVAEAAPGAQYSIDVYNPLSWRRTANDIIASGCNVAILTWWTVFWQPGFWYIERRLRRHGVKTIYFCHNLFDHKTGGVMGLINRVLGRMSRKILKQADGYIVQSSAQERQLRRLKPAARLMRRMHPIAAAADVPAPSKHLPQRGRLELLFFGLIRPYKGLDILLTAAEQLQDADVYLTVVGEPWGDVVALKQRLAQATVPNLETHLEYLDDAAAAQYFERADVVVLPYRSATGSAVVALAYAYGKPVLATKVDGLIDVVSEGRTGWLVAPESPEALATAIKQINREAAKKLQATVKEFQNQNDWPSMASAVMDFIKQLTR